MEKKSATMKFCLEDRGDPSVGIFGWFEMVTITRDGSNEFTEDEIEQLKIGLREALCPDGVCVTETEYIDATEKMNKALDELDA